MARFHAHATLGLLTALGLAAIGAVLVIRGGIDIYAIGFLAMGLYSLARTSGPLFLPSRYDRPSVSRKRLLVDVGGAALVAVTLWLLVFARTDIASQISV